MIIWLEFPKGTGLLMQEGEAQGCAKLSHCVAVRVVFTSVQDALLSASKGQWQLCPFLLPCSKHQCREGGSLNFSDALLICSVLFLLMLVVDG